MSLHTARVIPEKRYSCPPAAVQFAGVEKGIDMDLKKLTQDCVAARSAAIKACGESDDGGTCNLDATFLPLEKGVRSSPVVDAIRRAGLSARVSSWIGRGVMIQPPGEGQAGKRYASNAALQSALADAGWGVICYYQMD